MKPLLLALAPLALTSVALMVAAAAAAAPGPAPVAMGPVTSKFAPLSYFQDNCAHCHGDYGNAYGSDFGAHLNDVQMRQVVKDMAEGPAGAPLDQEQLDLETAWHESLRDKKPFGVVTSWKDGVLTGEATPGAQVWLSAGAQQWPAPLTDHTWKVALGTASRDWTPAQLHVKVGGKETVVKVVGAAVSPGVP